MRTDYNTELLKADEWWCGLELNHENLSGKTAHSVITRVLEEIEGTFIVVLSTAVEPGLYAMHTTNKMYACIFVAEWWYCCCY